MPEPAAQVLVKHYKRLRIFRSQAPNGAVWLTDEEGNFNLMYANFGKHRRGPLLTGRVWPVEPPTRRRTG